ncbi:MAG TPA: ABC transporter ATP-binding protein [Calditerricola sp.]
MRRSVLEVRDINAFHGTVQAVFGVSLEVYEGEVVALLGRNGAGKTTVLRSIMGLTTVRSGRILLKGKDVTGVSPVDRARSGIGWVPQDRGIFPDLTVRENLLVAARPHGGRQDPLAEVLELFPMLTPLLNRKGGLLSGGEQQLLSIARALVTGPEILLLDEPTEGLAPVMVDAVRKLVLQLRQRGVTILLAEQNLSFASQVADRGYVLQNGTVVLSGTMERCATSPEVARNLAV